MAVANLPGGVLINYSTVRGFPPMKFSWRLNKSYFYSRTWLFNVLIFGTLRYGFISLPGHKAREFLV